MSHRETSPGRTPIAGRLPGSDRSSVGIYSGRVSKAGIIEALKEARGIVAPAWEKAKKSDPAAIAEREVAGTGWLPAPLRRAA